MVFALATAAGCATSERDDSAGSALCSNITNRCAAEGGASDSCSGLFSASCEKLSLNFSPAFLDAVSRCIQTAPCDPPPLEVCLAKAASSLVPTGAQSQLAKAFCTCSGSTDAECQKTFYQDQGSVTAMGKLLLPFADVVIANVEKSCTGESCQSTFPDCAKDWVARSFDGTGVPQEGVECTLEATIHGSVESGDGGSSSQKKDGGGTGPGNGCDITSCDGCCNERGECLKGNEQDACGTAGRQCQACDGERSCDQGTCVDASCKLTCKGCCAATGCNDGTSAAACGKAGAACVDCGKGRSCTDHVCTVEGNSKWNVTILGATFPNKDGGNSDWDPFGGKPDPWLDVSTNSGSGSTDTWDDSLTPEWNKRIITGATASGIMAKFHVKATDDDPGPWGNDFMGECDIKITSAMFNSSKQTLTCKGSGATFTIDVRFDPT
jgi:hypothetical protein